MANANTPFGLKPVGSRNGAPYNGATRAYSVPASDGTALYVGSVVKLLGSSQTINGRILSDVTAWASGDRELGSIVGFEPDPDNLSRRHRPASTQRVVYVADAIDLLFEVQEVSGGTALTADDIGLNANLVVAAGSTVTGLSGIELNNATEATTNTLDVRIVGVVQRPDNAIGTNCKWLVSLNRHAFADQIAGV